MKYSLSDDTWDDSEIKAAHDVIDSHQYTMSTNVSNYEKMFAEKVGSKYAVMTNSGSSANLIMMAALRYSGRLKIGDEVIVTAVSWSTTYFPISQMGFKIRFVDIDPETLNIDVDALEKAITVSTRAVMIVNLLGNPNDFDRVSEICKRNDLLLLEDNCESLGAIYNGKYTGTFGLMGSFSTYYSHHLCTMEGGMVVTDDKEMRDFLLCIRSHGWTRNLPDDSTIYTKNSDRFYESFNFIMPGFNVRPLEIEAAVGIEQLKKLDTIIEQRRKNAQLFKQCISSKIDVKTQKECGRSSWFGFAIILPKRLQGHREEYINALRSSGIEVRPIVAGNIVRQEALRFLDYSVSGKIDNADYIHENGFFVGNHSRDMKEELNCLVESLSSVNL